MEPAVAPTAPEVLARYQRDFKVLVSEGKLRPLVFPYHFYGVAALMAYLCIRHTNRPNLYKARWILLAFIIWFQLKMMFETSTSNMAIGLAAGIVSAYGVMTALTWLVFMRPQFDAKRVERRHRMNKTDITETRGQEMDVVTNGDSNIRQRVVSNGDTNGKPKDDLAANGKVEKLLPNGCSGETEYYWQSYPDDIWERFDWVFDLIMNFRGPGWNWQASSIPSLPPFVRSKLGEPVDPSAKFPISAVGNKAFSTLRESMRVRVPQFIVGYMLFDVMKIVMMKDPYFYLGPNLYIMPSHVASMSPIVRLFYREALSAFAILVSLEMTFMSYALVVPLLPTSSLRAEIWYFPTSFGSVSSISTRGLSGVWGMWWHQVFRVTFSAPTNYLIAKGYLAPRSMMTKTLGSVFAFAISGYLHAAGSHTQLPDSNPWGPAIFFMSQALGVFIQSGLAQLFKPQIQQLPMSVRRATNVVFAMGWLLATGWIIADDFARGGLWLWEPIPISLLRGLGFGAKGEGWYCWKDIGVSWYTGKNWWESGIAM